MLWMRFIVSDRCSQFWENQLWQFRDKSKEVLLLLLEAQFTKEQINWLISKRLREELITDTKQLHGFYSCSVVSCLNFSLDKVNTVATYLVKTELRFIFASSHVFLIFLDRILRCLCCEVCSGCEPHDCVVGDVIWRASSRWHNIFEAVEYCGSVPPGLGSAAAPNRGVSVPWALACERYARYYTLLITIKWLWHQYLLAIMF